MSIRSFGLARRMFSIAISDWPPASTRASPPSCGKTCKNFVGGFGADIVERGGLHRRPPNRLASFVSHANREKPPAAPPPALRASAAKNCPMMTRVAPSSRRPPMLATLPPIAAS